MWRPRGSRRAHSNLEDHVGSLIINRKAVGEREHAREGEVRELLGKVEELRIMMKKQAPKIEKLTELQKTVTSNTEKMMKNTKRIDEVDQETKGIHQELNKFVVKAEATMKSQTDAAQGTKQKLELLTHQLAHNGCRPIASYAQKVANRQGDMHAEKVNNENGAKKIFDARRRPPPNTEAPPLRKRGTGDRQIVDHHLDGSVSLYFTREMKGSIVAARAEINEYIGINYVVKSINFLGDREKNLTEVCVLRKFARWFRYMISTITAEDRVLGKEYVDCNPFIPVWDNVDLTPKAVQQQRKPRHVKKILDQWYYRAVRSQSDEVRELYQLLLVRVAGENGRHLWSGLVQDVYIDPTLE